MPAQLLNAKNMDINKQEFQKVHATIAAVQLHMFPKDSVLPTSERICMMDFLYHSIFEKHYDKEIRDFVIEGAKILENHSEQKFVNLTNSEKEKILRNYEKSNYGSIWLKRIMTLSIEALFSDPIYRGNIKELGWKSIDTYAGYPRPKLRYIWGKHV